MTNRHAQRAPNYRRCKVSCGLTGGAGRTPLQAGVFAPFPASCVRPFRSAENAPRMALFVRHCPSYGRAIRHRFCAVGFCWGRHLSKRSGSEGRFSAGKRLRDTTRPRAFLGPLTPPRLSRMNQPRSMQDWTTFRAVFSEQPSIPATLASDRSKAFSLSGR